MVSAISLGWFADFGKPLPLLNCRPNRFILTNGKHPGKPENPEKTLGATQGNQQQLNLHIDLNYDTGPELNLEHIGKRRALSPLRHT